MLTQKRAIEVHNAQKQFPYWGNYRRFMTPEEIAYCDRQFLAHPHGSITFAAIVRNIAINGDETVNTNIRRLT